jgi:nicotinamidase-related amidase
MKTLYQRSQFDFSEGAAQKNLTFAEMSASKSVDKNRSNKNERTVNMKIRLYSFVKLAAMLCFALPTLGQAQNKPGGGLVDPKTNSITDGLPHSPEGGKALMNPNDVVILLLDHQSGLFQVVKDIGIYDLRSNVAALAKLGTLLKIPIITTASEPNGPNGPLIPEVEQFAPQATYVPRKGEVNAWDNELFVKTVRNTGKKTLIMAGIWTSVCVMFPALDAKAAGYKVYAVIDASGDPSELASQTTLARFTQAGVVPISTNAVTCELHRTWNRPEAVQIAELYTLAAPNYRAIMESYKKAQEAATQPTK